MTEMTTQQFDAFMEANGFGVSSETDFRSYVSDKDGDIVAIRWKLAQVIEPLNEKGRKALERFLGLEANVTREFLIGVVFTTVILAMVYVFIAIFA